MSAPKPQPIAEAAAQLAIRRCQPSESVAHRDWIAERHYLQSAPPGWHSREGRRDQKVSKKLRWVRTP